MTFPIPATLWHLVFPQRGAGEPDRVAGAVHLQRPAAFRVDVQVTLLAALLVRLSGGDQAAYKEDIQQHIPIVRRTTPWSNSKSWISCRNTRIGEVKTRKCVNESSIWQQHHTSVTPQISGWPSKLKIDTKSKTGAPVLRAVFNELHLFIRQIRSHAVTCNSWDQLKSLGSMKYRWVEARGLEKAGWGKVSLNCSRLCLLITCACANDEFGIELLTHIRNTKILEANLTMTKIFFVDLESYLLPRTKAF